MIDYRSWSEKIPGPLVKESGKLGDAYFSADFAHRFLLTRPPEMGSRRAEDAGPWWVTFLMLNPSTATHDQDDPTIAKCRKFARRFAVERGVVADRLGVRIVNLFAFRATDPKDCFSARAPVGGLVNDAVIYYACRESSLVVCAWGAHAKSRGRALEVRRMLRGAGVELYRLGPPSKEGSPKHPLYLKDSTPLESMEGP